MVSVSIWNFGGMMLAYVSACSAALAALSASALDRLL
ncbi:hypothetical protein DW974_06080 [Lachnospiraceae bacterium AM48-27BH]|nr:hypothetical protein DW974_06080 [Lachnospiraceae bacterium AM48-27BH]